MTLPTLEQRKKLLHHALSAWDMSYSDLGENPFETLAGIIAHTLFADAPSGIILQFGDDVEKVLKKIHLETCKNPNCNKFV